MLSSIYAQDFVGSWWTDQDHEQIINLFQYVEVFSKLRCSEKIKRKQLWIIPTRLEKISCAADHRWTYKIRENKAGKTAVGRWEEAGVAPNSYAVLSSLGA
jgi:hypothetical protein